MFKNELLLKITQEAYINYQKTITRQIEFILIEPQIVNIIKTLQAKGLKVIALTFKKVNHERPVNNQEKIYNLLHKII